LWPNFAKEYFATVIYIEIMYLPFGLEFAAVSPCIGCFPTNKKRRKVFFFLFFLKIKYRKSKFAVE